jgi:hypothetical protein
MTPDRKIQNKLRGLPVIANATTLSVAALKFIRNAKTPNSVIVMVISLVVNS